MSLGQECSTLTLVGPLVMVSLGRYTAGRKLRHPGSSSEHHVLPTTVNGELVERPIALYGVVRHVGSSSLHDVHYVAYTKAPDGAWYECNDTVIRRIPFSEVVSSCVRDVYILAFMDSVTISGHGRVQCDCLLCSLDLVHHIICKIR